MSILTKPDLCHDFQKGTIVTRLKPVFLNLILFKHVVSVLEIL